MAKKEVFAEQTVSGFSYQDAYSCYFSAIPSPTALVIGETYEIVWDGVTYTGNAVAANLDGADFVCIGNGALIGAPNTGEPFAIGYNTGSGYINFFALSAGESHTIGVYAVAADGASIVLKDRDGNPVEYPGVKAVRMMDEDGGTVDFIPAEDVPIAVETTVELDFSGGDMTVTPQDGQTFSNVQIPMPANLIPGNIAEGVNIAGIVGALKGVGAGGKIATGTFRLDLDTGQQLTITHGLGIIPDFIYVGLTTNATGDTTLVRDVFVVNNLLVNPAKTGYLGRRWYGVFNKGQNSAATSIDITGSTANLYIHNVTTETFTTPNNMQQLTNYFWFAVGGLT